jgi:REP element-mobilizing transposase RayT
VEITDGGGGLCQALAMPSGLRHFQQTRRSHFVTFSCYRRQPNSRFPESYDLFAQTLEDMRRLFSMCVYVVMPEHVHLLVSEPSWGVLSGAIHYLKLSFAKRLRGRVCQVSTQKTGANLGHQRFLLREPYHLTTTHCSLT